MTEVEKVLAKLAGAAARANSATQSAAAGERRRALHAANLISSALPHVEAAINQLKFTLAKSSGTVSTPVSVDQGDMLLLTFDVMVPFGAAGTSVCDIKLRADVYRKDAVSAELRVRVGGLSNFFTEVLEDVRKPADFDPIFARMIGALGSYVSPLT